MKAALLAVAALVPFQADFQAVAGPRWRDRAAQVWQESRFHPMAENKTSHAKGLAQFMDGTWAESVSRGVVPPGTSPFNPHWAIVAQHDYMNRQELFARRTLPGVDAWLGGLASYNFGAGNWRKAVRRADTAGAHGMLAWVRFCPAETQGYVDVIPRKAAEYRGAQ